MRSNLNDLGYHVTMDGKVHWERKKSIWKFPRIFSIHQAWKIDYEESGDIFKLDKLGLITEKFNILGKTAEVQEEAVKQLIIKTNLMAAHMEKIELDLKQWLVKGYMGYK